VRRLKEYATLKNPFYYGEMHTKYGIFDHAYEPLISRALFEQVQTVTDRYHKTPFQHGALPFVLRGFITCGHCGCMVSPEIKKKKYIYYSCTNAKGGCTREYVREEELMKQLTPYFDNIQLSDQQIEEITQYLKEIHESESIFHRENLERLRREQDKVQQRISKMYDDKLDGFIDNETYCIKLKEYKDKQYEILDQMQRHTVADEKFHITASTVMNLAQRARSIFESSEVGEKRQILDLVFQNLKLEGKKLALELREPFSMLSEIKGRPMNWRWGDSNSRPWQTPH
jgi:site-specific DNA recombinase